MATSSHTQQAATDKKPIINCHAHIFTGDHVPDLLGKTVLPWPLWKIKFRWVFAKFRWWYYEGPYKKKYGGYANSKAQKKFEKTRKFKENKLAYTLFNIAGFWLTLQVIHFFIHLQFGGFCSKHTSWPAELICKVHKFIAYDYPVFFDTEKRWLQLAILALVILFFKSGRNLLEFIAKQAFSWLKKLPGPETKKLLKRYLNIGRFAFHYEQSSTFSDLQSQYPNGSGFVILPMDMEYMQAGSVAEPYKIQMEKLADIKSRKKNIYPFVFADPRRIAAEAKESKPYFDYDVSATGKVELKNCFIKDYIEGYVYEQNTGKTEQEKIKFSGFKIYPALGYYPFDPLLLPLWKYAEQNELPILTHCVRGPMYYRGPKEKDWNYHPIFEQIMADTDDSEKNKKIIEEDFEEEEKDNILPIANTYYSPLLLPQQKNSEFSSNFTHPLNFICLLKKEFLAKAVDIAYQQADNTEKEKLKKIFGFTPSDKKTKTIATIANGFGLDNLKICFGHYGGSDEWLHYFEKDRFKHSAQLAKRPDEGINFIYRAGSKTIPAPGKPEQLWKYTDWYSIISSMMLQHPNVYADISYILHSNAEILPLLKQTLLNEKLKTKVLYGTDFYVVRNHKSDKNMLADMMGGLSELEFDQIARTNPREFLNL